MSKPTEKYDAAEADIGAAKAGDSSAQERLRGVLFELQQEAFQLRRRRGAATVLKDPRWQRLCIDLLRTEEAWGRSALGPAALDVLSHVPEPTVIRALVDLLANATNGLAKVCHTLRALHAFEALPTLERELERRQGESEDTRNVLTFTIAELRAEQKRAKKKPAKR